MYAEVVLTRPTHRRPPVGAEPLRGGVSRQPTYTYRLPEKLEAVISVGHLVQVPLRSSSAQGVVVAVVDTPPPLVPMEAIREVVEVLDPLPVVTLAQIELARWIAETYFEPLSQAMRLMLPPDLESRTTVVVRQIGAVPPAGLTSDEEAVLRALHRRGGRLTLSTLRNELPAVDPEVVVGALADQGLVEAHYAFVPPQPAPPRVQYVRLLTDDRVLGAALPRLGRPSKQADALLAIARRSDAPLTVEQLCALVQCGPGPIRALARREWVEITERRSLLVSLSPVDDERAAIGKGAAPDAAEPASTQMAALVALHQRGSPVELRQFQEEVGVSTSLLAGLEKRGLIRRIVEPSLVLLKLPIGQVLDAVVELRGAQKERAVLEALHGTAGRVWVGGLYAQTGAGLATLHRLADQGLVSLHADEQERPHRLEPDLPLHLTSEQVTVLRQVQQGLAQSMTGSEPFVALLHGVTGSGKTEIYLQALQQALAAGWRAVVLVPEISLTAQTVRRFEARFPGRVALLHSQLSLGQRYAVWNQLRQGQADVLIGPRSALFTPISRLGLIVVDEAHDPSYKQEDPIPLPAYDARDVAVALGRLTGAAVLMGSATPDLVSYHRAVEGAYHLLELPQRVVPGPSGSLRPLLQPLPPVRVVDLRQELRAGHRGILSRALREALVRTLAANEQAILYLNRRGTATFVLCRDCGYVASCPRCDVPLTFHQRAGSFQAKAGQLGLEAGAVPEATQRGSRSDRAGVVASGRLVCHRCNYREEVPIRCPKCGENRIRFFGLGTERVEQEVRLLLPEARVLRWDRDTATGLDHERYLEAFVDHRADVLVGTQMIAKGLDLPLVTLVGVISADTALNLPDFRSAERTFQLLVQVAGRAGRSQRGGQVIVQTYNPAHYAILAAAGHDYGRFYRQELAYRRALAYPPFARLVALRFYDPDYQRCRAEAERLARWLSAEIRRLGVSADLIGPAPCFFSRVESRYRWQIVLRTTDPAQLLHEVTLPWGWRVDVDPVSLL